MSDLDKLLQAFGEAGGDRGALADGGTAHLAAEGHSLLSSALLKGSTLMQRRPAKAFRRASLCMKE